MKKLVPLLSIIFLILIVFLTSNVNAVDVSVCQNITASGNYALTQNLSKDNTITTACINIQTPTVTLDCAGYSIFPNQTIPTNQIGIQVNASNVTIQNCNLYNYNDSITPTLGAVYIEPNSGLLQNVTFYNNTIHESYSSLYIANAVNVNVTDLAIVYTGTASSTKGLELSIENGTFTNINTTITNALVVVYTNYLLTSTTRNLNFSNISSTLNVQGIGGSTVFTSSTDVYDINIDGLNANLTQCTTCIAISNFQNTTITLKNAYINATGVNGSAIDLGGVNGGVNATISNATLNGALHAIYLSAGSTINFSDITIQQGNITNRVGSNLTFTNTSISTSNITAIITTSTNTYFVQPINVSIPAGATVNVSNYSLQTNYTATSGFALFNVTTLKYNSSGTFNYTNVTINTNITGLFGRTNAIITTPNNGNYQQINVPLSVAQCTTLSTPGVYTLTQNISQSVDKCMNVTAQNVTINCNGYWINSNSINAQYPIYTTYSNLSVNSCGFSNFVQNQSSYAVYTDFGANNATIFNSTFYNTTGVVYIHNNNVYANFSYNVVKILNGTTSIAGRSILLAANATMASNTITNITTTINGDVIIPGAYSTIYNNTIYAYASNTFTLINGGALNLNISNNWVTNTSGTIIVADSNGKYGIIANNIFLNSAAIALYLQGINQTVFNNTFNTTANIFTIRASGNYSNISYNTINSSVGSGIQLTEGGVPPTSQAMSQFGLVSYNTIIAKNKGIQPGSNSTVTGNTLTGFGAGVTYAFYLDGANYASIYSNTIPNSTGANILVFFLQNSNYSTISNNTITNLTSGSSTGGYLTGSTNATFSDMNITNTTHQFTLGAISSATLINMTFTSNTVSMGGGSVLTVKMPIRIQTLTSTGVELGSVTLSIDNTSNAASGTSNATGYLDTNATVWVYIGDNTPTNYSHVTISASKTGYASTSTTADLNAGTYSDYQTATVSLTATASSGGAGGGGGGSGGSGGAASSNEDVNILALNFDNGLHLSGSYTFNKSSFTVEYTASKAEKGSIQIELPLNYSKYKGNLTVLPMAKVTEGSIILTWADVKLAAGEKFTATFSIAKLLVFDFQDLKTKTGKPVLNLVAVTTPVVTTSTNQETNNQENETQTNEVQQVEQKTNASELPIIPIALVAIVIGLSIWFFARRKTQPSSKYN